MRRKTNAEPPPDVRRQLIAKDLEAFLRAGHKINHVPDGVSGQDPSGRAKPLKLGPPKN